MSYAWYRFRTTLGAERSYFLSVILLVGALGGLSMGAVAAARSTESSFSDYVASSHVPQLFVLDGVINPAIGLNSAYNAAAPADALPPAPRAPRGEHRRAEHGADVPSGTTAAEHAGVPPAEASVNGLDFTEDRVVITEGRMPDPHNADEIVLDAATREGARVSRRPGDPRRVAVQRADASGNVNAEREVSPSNSGPG